MNKVKIGQLLELYKRKFPDRTADAEALEPLVKWEIQVKRYTEQGKIKVDIILYPPEKTI